MGNEVKKIIIALAGNPNSGKTSLFNALTGARAHVGNYPGVTVEVREGRYSHDGRQVRVVDLPGTYSLTAYSMEELVARNFILNQRPDLVVDVVDAANLERNLYLAVQFMEIGVPVVLALNMMDMAEARGLKIDLVKLRDLLGLEVVPTVARERKGLEELKDAVNRVADQAGRYRPRHIRYGDDIDLRIDELSRIFAQAGLEREGYPLRWLAIKALERDAEVLKLVQKDESVTEKVTRTVDQVARHLRTTVDDEPEGVIADHRYGFITAITKQAVTKVRDVRRNVSDKIDLVVLNRVLGPLILLGVLYAIYQLVFWASEAPVSWFEAFFSWLGQMAQTFIPEGPVQSLIVSGVIDGVGGVLGFVPLIAFMFLAIAALEDSGYMARIAFIMDRVLRTFGLHGSSVLALLVGGGISGGCAVPGVMAARTLRDPKERLATILVTPFMNCGAKLPVFAILTAAFFSRSQGQVMFLLTLIAWAMALTAARILRWTILKGEQTPFVMELPPYRWPTLRGLIIHTWERIWQYIKKAGTVILAISILMWAIMAYPDLPAETKKIFNHQREQLDAGFMSGPGGKILAGQMNLTEFERLVNKGLRSEGLPDAGAAGREVDLLVKAVITLKKGGTLTDQPKTLPEAAKAYLFREQELETLNQAQASARLRRSIAGRVGTALETLSRPLGFEWRTNLALIGGFAAKEIVISTLGTAYSLGDTASEESLAKRLRAQPGWNPLVAFTLILFVMMYSPCAVTLVTIGREVGWRWSLFAMSYTTAAAYLVSLAAAQAGRALGLGL